MTQNKELTSPSFAGSVSSMAVVNVSTTFNPATGRVSLVINGRTHGSFGNAEEILRYAARAKAGNIVLFPGQTTRDQVLTQREIQRQVTIHKRDGFK